MAKTLNVSILGYGMMGTVRAVAYEAISRYYTDAPIKPVLYQAFTLPVEAEAAKESGWDAKTDLDAVIKDSECDYVDVCLPNSMHHDVVMSALEAGKHVFCEKPLAVTVDEAREMMQAAEAKPELLNSVNFVYRRCPSNVYARRLVKSGRFGKLLEARSFYNQSWGGPDTPYSWRFSKTGGTLGDLGSHALDMLYFVTGMRPIELCAIQGVHIPYRFDPKTVGSDLAARMNRGADAQQGEKVKVETDDATRIMYTLPDGAIGSLECTRNAWGAENTHGYELYFENGAIAWNYDDVNYLNVYDATRPDRGWTRVLTNRGGDDFSYKSFADGHMYGYRDFTVNACYENILKIAGADEIAPIATFRDAYDVERTIEAVRKSWEERCWVKLADFT
ncbi:MAG: Gfo/Idh/MocA family protein [Thermoguttaceae bacterium]|jgi:predicted dehydrogenase